MSLIRELIAEKFPGWPLPTTSSSTWQPCRCPWHDDQRPSASISDELDAFNCHTCGYKGDALAILMREERLDFARAIERAEELTSGRYTPVSPRTARKPSRRTFGESGDDAGSSETVPTGVRRRSFT